MITIRARDSPATFGSRSAPSAEAEAHETLGKGNTPAIFDSSRLHTSGREKRLTTFMNSPIIYTLKRTPPTIYQKILKCTDKLMIASVQ